MSTSFLATRVLVSQNTSESVLCYYMSIALCVKITLNSKKGTSSSIFTKGETWSKLPQCHQNGANKKSIITL